MSRKTKQTVLLAQELDAFAGPNTPQSLTVSPVLREIQSSYRSQIANITESKEIVDQILEDDIDDVKDKNLLKQLKIIRAETLARLRKELPRANFSDLSKALKTITEIARLEAGESTQNIAYRGGLVVLSPEQIEEVNKRFS
jgi:hypothetical protein